jgi:hypothetical protein
MLYYLCWPGLCMHGGQAWCGLASISTAGWWPLPACMLACAGLVQMSGGVNTCRCCLPACPPAIKAQPIWLPHCHQHPADLPPPFRPPPQVDPQIDDDLQRVLAFLACPESAQPEAVLAQAMALGEVNFRVMALLDKGHTSRWVSVVSGAWGADYCAIACLPACLLVCMCLVYLCRTASARHKTSCADMPPALPACQVRQPRAHPGAHHPREGQGHPHQRPRHARHGGAAEAGGGHGWVAGPGWGAALAVLYAVL